MNPKFAQTLSGTIADERRHVGFGENRIGSLIKEHPERKPDVEQMQKDMTYHMLATFSDRSSRQRGRHGRGAALAQEAGAPAARAAPQKLARRRPRDGDARGDGGGARPTRC